MGNNTYWVGPVDEDGFANLQSNLTQECYNDTGVMILVGDPRIVPSIGVGPDQITMYSVEATFDGETFSDPIDIDKY